MRFGHFFIDRPRFATVLSILLIIVGILAYLNLPVAQYPEVAPPTIVVRAVYPGATPEVIADTVATPIEQEVNGVEGMLYMTSQSTSDGVMTLTITFALGTDLDIAQVLVQNRVAIAEPRLPEEVRRLGVTTQKSSPDLMMVVHLQSPDDSYDQLYISNYAFLQIRDVLSRIGGVGDITIFGAREYSMRVWLDPERLQSLNLTAGDVVAALRQQNVQVATGTLGQPPMPYDNAFQFTVTTQGRFMEADEFSKVIVRAGDDGRLVRVGDVARVELGARDYVTNSYLDGKPAVAIAIFQRPGTNALATAEEIQQTMNELAGDFPAGLAHRIVYNPTEFVAESVDAVYTTIFEAVALVILVIIIFLQSWRAAIIPIAAIPVSLIGTFAVMSALGFSLNNLTLFGLVLAIGIVVDDAIVVVENIERKLQDGLSPREASKVTMDEVGTALIAMALVLVAVFIPTAFLGGISGQFFRQFAVTIAVATVISAFNSLTLSPALGAILLRSREEEDQESLWYRILGPGFDGFNQMFDRASEWYGHRLCRVVKRPGLWLGVFVLLIGLTVWMFRVVPGGFIPQQDQGYVIVAVELPKGASLQRTDDVIQRATEIILETPGAYRAVAFAGFSGATFSNASNAGAIFVTLKPFAQRKPGVNASSLVQTLQQRLFAIQEAMIFVIEPPPVRGLGNGGGFKMMVQDRQGRGLKALEGATWNLVGAANQAEETERVFSLFSTSTPQYYLDIDRTKAEMLQVPVENVFEALEIELGSAYVNDFNLFGRTYRVTAQADAPYRLEPEDIARLRARSETGAMVPLGSVANVVATTGPDRVVRHNLYPSSEIQGDAAAGRSSGEALGRMEALAEQSLPAGLSYEWTEIAYQQRSAGQVGLLIFPLSVLFVFLLLSAQYESWSLPLAIILIVPLCLLFAILGVAVRGMDNNILTQIGFVVLVGLATKNAILIVEFAKQQEDLGKNRWQAAVDAARLRLRPILMTAFAFILGVVPLVTASGAGAEMRQALGTAVFSGMLGVTLLGLLLTPVFYVVTRGFVLGDQADAGDCSVSADQPPAVDQHQQEAKD
ncbi:MAG: multidrug efflux RND transporter permease subunit [Wenzhouxiangellaceae bacterium]